MSFTSGTFLAPRALYIKCTTCFSWRATRFCVICITFIRALTVNHEPSLRAWETPSRRHYRATPFGAIPACMGNTLINKGKYLTKPHESFGGWVKDFP